MEHAFVETNGIRMHYVRNGEGPACLMLHGFPEHWYSWRHQIDGLAGAGIRAIAPDMRGYGDTDKPRNGYEIGNLVADVAGLIDALGLAKVTLVGHDWGGPIAWAAAMELPQVERLAILNGPHPRIYLRQLLTTSQLFKSWYIYMFLVPGLAERMLKRDDFRAVRASFRDAQRRAPQWVTDKDVEIMTDAMKQQGAVECGLRYYRANFGPSAFRRVSQTQPIDIPTLVIWGMSDRFVSAPSEGQLRRWVRGPLEYEQLPGVGHWVSQEDPETVNRLLIDFVKGGQ